MRVKRTGEKSVKRYDYTNGRGTRTLGWYARVWWNGRMHAKLFSDSRYGGERGAYQAALDYRNTIEIAVQKPRSNRQVVQYPRNPLNIQGVYLREINNYKRGIITGTSLVVEAVWYIDGKRRMTRFSVESRTIEEAIALGVHARERAILAQRNKERR